MNKQCVSCGRYFDTSEIFKHQRKCKKNMAVKNKEKEDEIVSLASEIEITKVPERTLYLTQHFGEGTLDKTKFSAAFTLPNMSLVVTIGKDRWMVDSQELISKIISAVEGKK